MIILLCVISVLLINILSGLFVIWLSLIIEFWFNCNKLWILIFEWLIFIEIVIGMFKMVLSFCFLLFESLCFLFFNLLSFVIEVLFVVFLVFLVLVKVVVYLFIVFWLLFIIFNFINWLLV